MALNEFTIKEAIEVCIVLRDKLELDMELPLQERWREKDALSKIINIAEKVESDREPQECEDKEK